MVAQNGTTWIKPRIIFQEKSSIFEQVFVESVVSCRMKWSFIQYPFSVEPVSSGQPVLSGHPAIPCGWLFNTGSTVLCTSALEYLMGVHVL